MDRRKIQLRKGSYNSEQYKKVIDTEFKTFVQEQPIVDNDTVEELFRLYDKLYHNIPLEGEVNSHQYILNRSSELVNLEKTSEDIQPFLDEIAQLRQQLLDANETIFELENNG
jgi:hypothetical protein|tara:strand:+ start:1680 stop:2018 length:339 start_codon:yes stop_codon:yes gene_type:complete